MSRTNFSKAQRDSMFQVNRESNLPGRIPGIQIKSAHTSEQTSGLIYYCENCKFCHTDASFFDVDHFVPDAEMRASRSPRSSVDPINMCLLCKSVAANTYGCNQTKGGRLYPPPHAGLAYTLPNEDLNEADPLVRPRLAY